MKTITIALIEKNKCNFDQMEEFATGLLYTKHVEETKNKIKININNYNN